jgi:hypothetical protein
VTDQVERCDRLHELFKLDQRLRGSFPNSVWAGRIRDSLKTGNWRQGCRQNPQAGMPVLRPSAGFPACGFTEHPCSVFPTGFFELAPRVFRANVGSGICNLGIIGRVKFGARCWLRRLTRGPGLVPALRAIAGRRSCRASTVPPIAFPRKSLLRPSPEVQ